MKTILICPHDAPGVPALAARHPLAITPFLGGTPLEHALTALAADGVKHVTVIARDRPGILRSHVGSGEAWGITLTILPGLPGVDAAGEAVPAPGTHVVTLDHLPQLPQAPLWRSYRNWYAAQQKLMPGFAGRRVGMREMHSGVFVGLRSRVSPDARLLGPCWVGDNVFVGPGATVGPGSIIEDGSYLDEGADVTGSIVGPRTFVGAFTEVRDSFAWGNHLVQLDTGSVAEITDPFLLGATRPRTDLLRAWLHRIGSWWPGRPKQGLRITPSESTRSMAAAQPPPMRIKPGRPAGVRLQPALN